MRYSMKAKINSRENVIFDWLQINNVNRDVPEIKKNFSHLFIKLTSLIHILLLY